MAASKNDKDKSKSASRRPKRKSSGAVPKRSSIRKTSSCGRTRRHPITPSASSQPPSARESSWTSSASGSLDLSVANIDGNRRRSRLSDKHQRPVEDSEYETAMEDSEDEEEADEVRGDPTLTSPSSPSPSPLFFPRVAPDTSSSKPPTERAVRVSTRQRELKQERQTSPSPSSRKDTKLWRKREKDGNASGVMTIGEKIRLLKICCENRSAFINCPALSGTKGEDEFWTLVKEQFSADVRDGILDKAMSARRTTSHICYARCPRSKKAAAVTDRVMARPPSPPPLRRVNIPDRRLYLELDKWIDNWRLVVSCHELAVSFIKTIQAFHTTVGVKKLTHIIFHRLKDGKLPPLEEQGLLMFAPPIWEAIRRHVAVVEGPWRGGHLRPLVVTQECDLSDWSEPDFDGDDSVTDEGSPRHEEAAETLPSTERDASSPGPPQNRRRSTELPPVSPTTQRRLQEFEPNAIAMLVSAKKHGSGDDVSILTLTQAESSQCVEVLPRQPEPAVGLDCGTTSESTASCRPQNNVDNDGSKGSSHRHRSERKGCMECALKRCSPLPSIFKKDILRNNPKSATPPLTAITELSSPQSVAPLTHGSKSQHETVKTNNPLLDEMGLEQTRQGERGSQASPRRSPTNCENCHPLKNQSVNDVKSPQVKREQVSAEVSSKAQLPKPLARGFLAATPFLKPALQTTSSHNRETPAILRAENQKQARKRQRPLVPKYVPYRSLPIEDSSRETSKAYDNRQGEIVPPNFYGAAPPKGTTLVFEQVVIKSPGQSSASSTIKSRSTKGTSPRQPLVIADSDNENGNSPDNRDMTALLEKNVSRPETTLRLTPQKRKRAPIMPTATGSSSSASHRYTNAESQERRGASSLTPNSKPAKRRKHSQNPDTSPFSSPVFSPSKHGKDAPIPAKEGSTSDRQQVIAKPETREPPRGPRAMMHQHQLQLSPQSSDSRWKVKAVDRGKPIGPPRRTSAEQHSQPRTFRPPSHGKGGGPSSTSSRRRSDTTSFTGKSRIPSSIPLASIESDTRFKTPARQIGHPSTYSPASTSLFVSPGSVSPRHRRTGRSKHPASANRRFQVQDKPHHKDEYWINKTSEPKGLRGWTPVTSDLRTASPTRLSNVCHRTK